MRKISTIIIVVLGLFVVLSLGTIGFITLSTASKALEIEASRRLESLAQQKATELEATLITIESYIGSLNSSIKASLDENLATAEDNVAYMEAFEEEFNLFIVETINALPSSYSAYVVFNPQLTNEVYQIIYFRDERNELVHLEDAVKKEDLNIQTNDMAWFFLPVLKGRGVWSDPYFDSYLNQQIITYSEPIIINDEIIGIVGTDILFKDFESFITEISVYETGYAFLMNQNHDLLVHDILGNEANMRTIENGLYIPLSNQIHFYEHGSQKYNFYGEEKIMGYDHLYNGWVIGIAPPLNEVYLSLRETQTTSVIVFSVGILVFLILARFVGKYLSKPIEQLAQTVSLIGDGYLDEPIDESVLKHSYEIELLANTIDKMRMSQKDVFEKLLHHNESLDQKVSERTSELMAMNQELEAAVTSLESAQLTIADMREQEAVNDLIQHLTQKLGTPIATAITASSYLIKRADDYQYNIPDNPSREVGQSASLIFNSQQQLKSVLDSLKQLSEDYTEETPRHFPIKAHINHTAKNRISLLEKEPFKMILEADDQLMVYLQMDMMSKLINTLLTHSISTAKNLSNVNDLCVTIRKEDDTVMIDYHDVLTWNPSIGERIFDPYYQMEVTKGTSGLELYLIQHIVLKGFQGSIKTFETETHQLGFHIELPERV